MLLPLPFKILKKYSDKWAAPCKKIFNSDVFLPANRHFYYLSLTYRLHLACLLTYSGTDVFTRTHTVLRTKNIRKCMPVFNTTRKRFSTSPVTSETFSCTLRIMVRFPLAGNNTISSAAFYKTAYVVYRISEKNSYFMGKSLLLQALFQNPYILIHASFCRVPVLSKKLY